MDDEPSKPAKRIHRNLLHKMGKKLEKFEQKLGVPSPNLSHGYVSTSDLSASSHRSDYDNDEQDTVSLQYHAHGHSDSPRAVLRHKHGERFSYQHSSISSEGSRSSTQWHVDAEESDSFVRDASTVHDQEMKILCQDLMEDKSVNFYQCREYDKKISLLRMAVSFSTPKVTVPVILFLENTLSKPIFYELLKRHPSAVRNYINVAKLRLQSDHHIAMLKQFDRNEDIAILRLQQADGKTDYHSKTALLDQAAIELSAHSWWHSQINEYQHLLRKQRELQSALPSSHSNVQLENRTARDTYKAMYEIDFRRHKLQRQGDKAVNFEQSKELETALHLSSEMIMCGRLSAIMHCGLRMHYDDFVHQAMHQNFFSKKYVIAPENFADMVYSWIRLSGEGHEKASEKAEPFLNMIHNPRRRVYYAEKFQNYDVAMDTIASALRDRVQLEHLRRRIPQDHPSYHRATALLENTKWRN